MDDAEAEAERLLINQLRAQEICQRSYERARADPQPRNQYVASVLSFVERANRFDSMEQDLAEQAALDNLYALQALQCMQESWEQAFGSHARARSRVYAQPGDAPIPDHYLRDGALFYRELPESGDQIVVWPMSYGKARLCVGPIGTGFIETAYCYPDPRRAIEAGRVWSGRGDPLDGWTRHPDTGRRRVDGDPQKETVRW